MRQCSGINEAANPVLSGRRDTLLQLPLFMELDQLVFMILRQSLPTTRQPVPLRPEQVGFCPQGLEVSLRVFVVLAMQIRESITSCNMSSSFCLVFRWSPMISRAGS